MILKGLLLDRNNEPVMVVQHVRHRILKKQR